MTDGSITVLTDHSKTQGFSVLLYKFQGFQVTELGLIQFKAFQDFNTLYWHW